MAGTIPSTTSYPLPHAQRLRLIRSTRKVESLLGETPLLGVDDSSRPHRTSRPVLIVRLPSVSVVAAIHSPLSPTSGISLNSPASASAPTLVAEDDATRRRKSLGGL
ncbi:hypothetical protein DFH09DRAFT_1306651 [Mycena vulgaris]|nr:hypothetical protein DFH09DRAFT_1306651 [Mycena vulgaris]